MTARICNTGRRAGALGAACAAAAALGACGHDTGPFAAKAAPALAAERADSATVCRDAVVAALDGVARRIYEEAQSGYNATAYAHIVERSPALIAAVSRGDATATKAALMPLLARQLLHVRVTKGATVLADLGKPNPFAPTVGTLHDGSGRVIGRYALAVQDVRAYVQVVHGLTAAEVLLRAGRHQLLGTLTPGPPRIPARGRIRYRGTVYEASSFAGTTYPSGPLRISVLVPTSMTTGCAGDRAATIAATLGAVGRRIYEGEASSGKVALTIRRMEASARFRRAVAASDVRATRSAIEGFFRLHQFHIVRARVFRRGRLLFDLGGPYVLAPARAVLMRDRSGRPSASFLVAVQDDTGYAKLAQVFTGADVVMRMGPRIAVSTISPAPVKPLPTHGRVVVAGRPYRVYTFSATAFPSGSVSISLLFGSG